MKELVILQVECGFNHYLALLLNKRVVAWGNNEQMQCAQVETVKWLKNGTLVDRLLNVTAIRCGSEHSLALTQEGRVYAWG